MRQRSNKSRGERLSPSTSLQIHLMQLFSVILKQVNAFVLFHLVLLVSLFCLVNSCSWGIGLIGKSKEVAVVQARGSCPAVGTPPNSWHCGQDFWQGRRHLEVKLVLCACTSKQMHHREEDKEEDLNVELVNCAMNVMPSLFDNCHPTYCHVVIFLKLFGWYICWLQAEQSYCNVAVTVADQRNGSHALPKT